MSTITHAIGDGKTVELTTTQHSAYGDLIRFGELVAPWGNGRVDRGTKYGFGAKTLQALVDAGFAEWLIDPRGVQQSPRTIVRPGESLRRNTIIARRKRVAEAEAYVVSHFFPPLPAEYGEVAVTALEEFAEHGYRGIVNLNPDLNPKPRGSYIDSDGDWACPVLDVIKALRIGHLIDDFEDW